jgi:hypothetical protein
MAKNKKSKSLLNEATVRRMMRLADIPELSESFFSETGAGRKGSSYGDLGKAPDDPTARDYEETRKGDETESGASAYGPYPSKGDEKEDGGRAYMGEADEEEDALEDELGAEDEIADEEGAELDAEASGGDAEITPEAAQAIVDLAAQLEASGALEGGEEEVEAEVEMSDVDGEEEVEVEGEEEEFEGLEEALAKHGIEVIDDKKLNEAVRKRVIARLRKEKRAKAQEAKVNQIADRIFARLQKK